MPEMNESIYRKNPFPLPLSLLLFSPFSIRGQF